MVKPVYGPLFRPTVKYTVTSHMIKCQTFSRDTGAVAASRVCVPASNGDLVHVHSIKKNIKSQFIVAKKNMSDN